MKIAFFATVVVGTFLGLALARPPEPVAAATPAAAAAPADKPIETVLEREEGGHFLAVADVNDEPIRFVVDTGADTVALTTEDARRAHVAFNPGAFVEVGRGAGGPVRGQEVRIANLVLDGKRASDVRAVVLEGASMSLLAQSYLRKVGSVLIEGDRMTLR